VLMDEREARAITAKLLGFARADDASVGVAAEEYAHLRFAANAVTTSGRREDATASVTVWIGGKRGAATTNALDDASLRAAVEQAETLARVSPVDREYVPTLGPQKFRPTAQFAEATTRITPAARARTVGEIIAMCERAGVVGAGFHQASARSRASATKNGNFYFERETDVNLSVTARTKDGTGSGYFQRGHFDAAQFDAIRIARESIAKAVNSRSPRRLDPGVYTVILEAQAVGDLYSLGFDARSAEEGRSSFSAPGGKTRLGEQIFDERVQIYSDPWHPQLPASAAAQGGLPAEKLHLVRGGKLENLVYSRFWAKERKREPTPGPVNLILESSGPAQSLEEMIRTTERGLLVSHFWYIRSVDPRTALFTGLTRDGVWLVEGGKVRHPVNNFRFNESVIRMLAPGNLLAIGRPERINAGSMFPPLKVKEFNFTSKSEAV
jgi:predicted Zn-dependent protease